MLTREEYLERSKENALALLSDGRIREAVSRMMMDILNSPSPSLPHEIHALGICAAAAGDTRAVREYIEGFN
ncbi:hypothetical protein ACVWZ4_004348 [Bradyrhizobium sp. USDA 4472]